MKKLLAFIVGVLLFIPLTTVHAIRLDPTTGIYDTDTEVSVALTANPPAGDFNAVSVRLNIEGGEILDFVQATGTEWIGLTKDCLDNTTFFTSNQICLSLAKSTNINSGELIGTLTVKVTGTSVKITKAEGNIYSDGENSVEDLGDAALYYNSAVTTNVVATSYPTEEVVNNDSTLLVISIAVIAILAVGLIVFFIIKKRNQSLTINKANPKTKIVAVVLAIGTLAITTGIIGLSISNNQAPEQSSAYDACDVGTKQCLADGVNYKVCNQSGRWGADIFGCEDGSTCTNGACVATSPCEASTYNQCLAIGGAWCSGPNLCFPSNRAGDVNCTETNIQNGNAKINIDIVCGRRSAVTDPANPVNPADPADPANPVNPVNPGGGTGTGSTTTPRKAICGESCNIDTDCGVTQFGVQPNCVNKMCTNPACPSDFNKDAQCACKTSSSKCGDRCGIWSDGFQPLCGDGVSSCSWVNGPTCGGSNQTYCLPTTLAADSGYTKKACSAEKSYEYIVDSKGAILSGGTEAIQAKLKDLCNPTPVTPENTAPKGYFDSVSCEFAAGWACDSDDYSANVKVDLYVDGPVGQGTYVGASIANLSRENAVGELCNGNSSRGYNIQIPSNLYNTGERVFYAYPINTPEGANTLSAGGPRTLNTNSCGTNLTPLLACGNMDSDGDGKLTVIDFASFAKAFNTSCSNTDFIENTCGSKDTNNNGKIDIVDFANFANKYQKDSCAI